MNEQSNPSGASKLDETTENACPPSESSVQSSSSDAVDQVTQLVAYLDGELAADEVAVVEQRLAEDEDYREHLRQLQQSWDLLETLPRTSVDEGFTRSTVEMVALSVGQQVHQRLNKDSWDRRLRLGMTGLVAAVFAVGGFGLVYERLTRENRQLMRDLPVIDRVDLYREVNSIEFLEKLASEGLFDEEQTDAP
jgi:hypothetical protein